MVAEISYKIGQVDLSGFVYIYMILKLAILAEAKIPVYKYHHFHYFPPSDALHLCTTEQCLLTSL